MLINLAEHSATNCKLIESLHVQPVAKQPDPSPYTTSSQGLHGGGGGGGSYDDLETLEFRQSHKSSVRALVDLFLQHHQKAESADIEVRVCISCV